MFKFIEDDDSEDAILAILFIPGIEFSVLWVAAAAAESPLLRFIFIFELLKLCCSDKWSCVFTSDPLTVDWHGFPSRTKTGTATRRGDGSGFISKPFSWRALLSL